MKKFSSINVFDAALQRIVEAYQQGHRLVVAFSAGKDSTVTLELCILAAGMTGNLPVEVYMRDEEIMYPGTYEYAERIMQRKEVRMRWLISGQASINIFNRRNPYYWVFDKLLQPEEWMRQPPAFAEWTEQMSLYNIVNPLSYPPQDGSLLYVTMGVRASESRRRNMLIHKSGSAISNYTGHGMASKGRELEKHFRPIYDWSTADVWLAIKEKGWDYNKAYDTMTRFGLKREKQRIAPVTMTPHGVELLQMASKAWPDFFDRLSIRLPGVRLAAKFGKRVLEPIRRSGETWEQAYWRINVRDAPDWIARRSTLYHEVMLRRHRNHSDKPIDEILPCPTCSAGKLSWWAMTKNMYFGDPFLLDTDCAALGYLEPEQVRPGAGVFDGKPIF